MRANVALRGATQQRIIRGCTAAREPAMRLRSLLAAFLLAVLAFPASAGPPFAYVTNQTPDNTVSVVDVNALTVVATVLVGDHPTGVVVDPVHGNRVYVANFLEPQHLGDRPAHEHGDRYLFGSAGFFPQRARAEPGRKHALRGQRRHRDRASSGAQRAERHGHRHDSSESSRRTASSSIRRRTGCTWSRRAQIRARSRARSS